MSGRSQCHLSCICLHCYQRCVCGAPKKCAHVLCQCSMLCARPPHHSAKANWVLLPALPSCVLDQIGGQHHGFNGERDNAKLRRAGPCRWVSPAKSMASTLQQSAGIELLYNSIKKQVCPLAARKTEVREYRSFIISDFDLILMKYFNSCAFSAWH